MRALLAIALLLGGCATTIDAMYLLHGKHTDSDGDRIGVGVGEARRTRSLEFRAGQGLVCHDVEEPFVTRSAVRTHYTNPNGYRLPMRFLTALEASITGITLAAREYTCSRDGCDNRGDLYLYLIPLFADIAWGTYRSFTIHNPIVRNAEVRWPGGVEQVQGVAYESSCPVGTEIVFQDRVDTQVVHVGEGGVVVAAELDLALRFVLAHPGFSVGGQMQLAGIGELVAHARTTLAPPAALPAPSTTVAPTSTPTITTPTVTVPSEVCVSNPLAEVCAGVRPRR